MTTTPDSTTGGQKNGTAIRRRLYLDKNLLIVYCITLTAIMSVSSLTPAFPSIIAALGIDPEEVGLLITVFTFPGVILTPILGVLADRYGRKRIVVPSLFLFGIAGGSCAFTTNFETLLLLRFFQGIGAGALGSLNATIVGDLFSGKERTTAMGYNASVLNIGVAAYPVIGGFLAVLGWNYPFIMAFLGIPVGFLVLVSLKNPEPRNEQRIADYFRNLFISLNDRRVVFLILSCGCVFIILYGAYLTFIPLFMKEVFDAGPPVTGVLFGVIALLSAVTSSQLGRIAKRIPETRLLRFTYIVYALALAAIPLSSHYGILLIPVILFALAHGTNIPVTLALISGMAPLEYRGAFLASNGMVLRLGQTIGPLFMGLMFTLGGLNLVFFSAAGIAILMFIILSVVFHKE
ncbi:MFS transporter [candidate division KSB1 bacterium]